MRSRSHLAAAVALVLTAAITAPLGAQNTAGAARARRTPATAARGERQIICRGAAIPAGWILVNDLRETSMCLGSDPSAVNAYNVWVIERFDRRPVGATVQVCANTPVPAGWVLVDVYRDKDLCGHPADLFAVNVKRIRRTR